MRIFEIPRKSKINPVGFFKRFAPECRLYPISVNTGAVGVIRNGAWLAPAAVRPPTTANTAPAGLTVNITAIHMNIDSVLFGKTNYLLACFSRSLFLIQGCIFGTEAPFRRRHSLIILQSHVFINPVELVGCRISLHGNFSFEFLASSLRN